MTAKEYLRQTFKLDNEINSLIQAVETLEAKATKVTTVLDPNKVSSGNLVNREDTIVKICDYKNLINNKIDRLVDLKRSIHEDIYKIENADHRTLLTLRYINLKYFEEIAVEMSYSYRNILYMHGAALQSFEKVCTPLHIKR